MQNGYALAAAATHWPCAVKREDSDLGLVGNIAAGDRLSMRTLYLRHHVQVYRFVLRLTGDRCKAEDIVSEVFFDVWRQAGRFEGRCQVSTWLLAMARNKAISALRRRQDEPLEDAVAEGIADEADDPQLALEKKDAGSLLRACLRQLSREHREVIDLVYYHEKSVNEAAEIVGIPCNTVKTRMYYARRRMRELFEQASAERMRLSA